MHFLKAKFPTVCQDFITAVAQFELADISKTQYFFLRDTKKN